MALKIDMADINRILDTVKDFNFDDFSESKAEELGDFLNSHGFKGAIDTGATKAVFIMLDKPFVIKFPFMGIVKYDWNDVYEDYDYDNFWFEEFAYAPEDSGWDYCMTEVRRYDYAKTEFFEAYLAEPEFLDEVNGYPIYVQEKCNIYGRNICKSTKEDRDSAVKILDSNGIYYNIDLGWIADFMLTYGEEEMIRFMEFLSLEGWDDDLRNANIGYNTDGRPVLIDYASYCEQSEEE